MIADEFKQELLATMEAFGNSVRIDFKYEDEQFDRLKLLLEKLATALRTESAVDKDLAMYLYSLPQIVRNMFLSYPGPIESRPEIVNRLEDAWIELDALILECFRSE